MAHSGTMDLGGRAQAKQSGNRWPVVMLTLVVVVATIAAVWFASSAGRVGGTSAIEAQRDAVTLSSNEYLDSILDRAHATPYSVTISSDEHLDSILDRAHAAPYAATISNDEYLDSILDRAHAMPYSVTISSDEHLDSILDRAHAAPYAGPR